MIRIYVVVDGDVEYELYNDYETTYNIKAGYHSVACWDTGTWARKFQIAVL